MIDSGGEKHYSDAIYYDSTNGFGGAAIFPIGTEKNPANNIANLTTLLAAMPWIKKVIVSGDITFGAGAAINGINFVGQGAGVSTFTQLTRNLNNCIIEGFNVTIDTLVGNLILQNCGWCNIDDVTGDLTFKNCGNITLIGTITGDVSCIQCGNITGNIIIGDIYIENCGVISMTDPGALIIKHSGNVAITRANLDCEIEDCGIISIPQVVVGVDINIKECGNVAISNHAGGDIHIRDCDDVNISTQSTVVSITLNRVKSISLNNVAAVFAIHNSGDVLLQNIVAATATINVYGENDIAVAIPVSNTAGACTLYGFAVLNGAGGGMTVNDLTRTAVQGNRTGAAIYAKDGVSNLVNYVKGLVDAGIAIAGEVADAGPAVTDFDTNLAEATNNHYNGGLVMFVEGVCLGQFHLVDVYTGGTKNMSFASSDQWTDVPANGDAFVLIPFAGAYLKKIFTDVALIKTQTDKIAAKMIFSPKSFWSNPQLGLTVTTPAGTLTLPSVVIAGIPAGATIVHAKAFLVSRIVENLNVALNKLDGATVAATSQVIQIQKGAGARVDAITFLDDQFSIAGSTREGGPVVGCATDLAATITGNDTYSFQWLLAKADLASLYFQVVHMIIELDYTV